ncbi:COX15/CtaA family protein [Edaphobacter dinghuensis]|uniref:Cytochrome oxidase assembly protein n=1 Tax=Edaphobacter dinghuensis TaxID=1560005 RepID=A0A917H8N9_9BACT|nr:COX15/CtaA family protein [Edaphobacter dinghuensis]GGG70907.1 cytochrome oxidase assembly protein [Edaphobacter dinghuensis]
MATVSAETMKRTPKALVRYAWAVVAYNILVILWGAIVRTSGSGAGCGDNWPLCNGDFVPHHPRLATIIEFAHRSMSGISTILVIGLVAWTFYATKRGHRARRAAVASAIFLVTEALLGAVLVLGGYVQNNISTARVIMQSIHFTNTLMFLGSLALTAWWLGARSLSSTTSAHSNKSLAAPAWIAIIATIATGATGAVAALADTLFPSPSLLAGFASDFAANSPLLVRMRWVHPAAAVAGFCCVMWLVWKLRSQLAWTVAALLGLQFVLGIADVLLLAPTWIQIVHLLGADLYWVALVCLAAEALWGQTHTAALAE